METQDLKLCISCTPLNHDEENKEKRILRKAIEHLAKSETKYFICKEKATSLFRDELVIGIYEIGDRTIHQKASLFVNSRMERDLQKEGTKCVGFDISIFQENGGISERDARAKHTFYRIEEDEQKYPPYHGHRKRREDK